jgi:hypothetical protein
MWYLAFVIYVKGLNIPIRLGFKNIDSELHQDFVLHEIAQSEIHHDISLYLGHEFELISRDHELLDWPGDKEISGLTSRADKLFIYAATICRFVKDSQWSPKYTLSNSAKRRIFVADTPTGYDI